MRAVVFDPLRGAFASRLVRQRGCMEWKHIDHDDGLVGGGHLCASENGQRDGG